MGAYSPEITLTAPFTLISQCSFHKCRSALMCPGLFPLKDGVAGVRDAAEKKAKRQLEREDLDTEGRRDKKHTHKRQKMSKKNLQRRAASTSSSPRSDFSQSDDSDEEMVTCPAERCQQPEGNEVRKTRRSRFSEETVSFRISSLLINNTDAGKRSLACHNKG